VIGKIIRSVFNFISETLELSVLALFLFLALYVFLVRPHYVNGTSMLPSFHNNDKLLVEVISYKILGKEPNRGDVIVFHPPNHPNLEYIKRVVALPGEKIKIQNGDVFIINQNHPEGILLEEPYLGSGVSTEATKRGVILEDEVFDADEGYVVMGDNRENSYDSRDWGVIKKGAIVGRAWLRYWPTNRLGIITTPKYEE
jgi:signal peptidase I